MKFVAFSKSVAGKKFTAMRADNQDRVLCRELDVNGHKGVLMAVADGITSCPRGGSVARWLVERHFTEDRIAFSAAENPLDTLRVYLSQLFVQFKAEFAAPDKEEFLRSGASLSVGLLHDGKADFLWAGDSPIYVSKKVRNGYDTTQLSRPDQDAYGVIFNCFAGEVDFNPHSQHVDLAPGDIVTIASDGAAIDEGNLGHIYKTKTFSLSALNEIMRISTSGPLWDDISVACGQWQA